MENIPAAEKIDKGALQSQWINARMLDHPNWRLTMPAARQVIIHERKRLVVWRASAKGPQVIDLLQVSALAVSFTSGLAVTLKSGTLDRDFLVSTHPREILPEVFVWISPFAEVRFAPMKFDSPTSAWRTTVPIRVRTSGGSDPQPGQVVVSSLKEFCAQWPELTV